MESASPGERQVTSGRPTAKGRGSQINPANRFYRIRLEDDSSQLEEEDEEDQSRTRNVPTEYLPDDSQSIVSENHSPDVGFRFSLNPYRGCSHGCSYCYARPYHEFLGLSAGLDFETKVFVKHDAPRLLEYWLARENWHAETIALSGATDGYQGAEREFQITRGCLQVACACRQPIAIVTKNALVLRDLDLLQEMAQEHVVRVAISLTTLDQSLARVMEPRTSSPAARLQAIAKLREAGVSTQVMLAPIIPGLNDCEIPLLLRRAAEAGAESARFALLRLPLSVKPVFLEWLARAQPAKKSRIESLIRATRNGKLDDATFNLRMRGAGPVAEQIAQTFRVFAAKYHLDRQVAPLVTTRFRPPRGMPVQGRLF
jgi:DNA repair photolyase